MQHPDIPGELVMQTLAMPANTNTSGDIFGGWLMSEMDLGASILAKKYSKSRTATVALDSLSFSKPVFVGDVVTCYAHLLSVGRSSMRIQVDTWVIRGLSGEYEQVTSGIFTFVAIDEQGRPHPADPTKRS
jgi:acyl-CoA thioesterase YciA